jgi:N-acetylneuraminic acid mutarotase
MHKLITLIAFFFFFIATDAQTQYGWVEKSGLPAPGRHRSTALTCGNRAYVGLGHVNSIVDVLYQDWWEYDPGSDTWSQKANYAGGLRYHATGFTIGNYMYVGTGRDPSATLHTDFWKYDPANNTWTSVSPLPGPARRGAVGFEIAGNGYVGTGSYYADFYKYNPVSNSWTAIASIPTGRTSAVGMSLNGKGYCGTGDVGGNSADWWEYNPAMNTWTQKANLPGLPRMEACGFTLGGRCFVGTGDNYSSGDNYSDFWAFNPSTNSWIQVADFDGAARRYMVAVSLNGKAYAGLGTSGMNYSDWWEYGTISGTEEHVVPSVNVYPVPSNGPVTFEFSSAVKNSVTCILYDLKGNAVRVSDFESCSEFSLEKDELHAGTYVYSITSGSQFISGGKIIFQ